MKRVKKEFIRSVYQEHVGPKFLEAQERFLKHFDARYRLIEGLRMSVTGYGVESSLCFPLAVMGIKPMSVLSRWNLRHLLLDTLTFSGLFELRKAGLDIATWERSKEVPSILVFDPVLLAPILSNLLNRLVTVEETKLAITELVKGAQEVPHDVFGYPQPRPGKYSYIIQNLGHYFSWVRLNPRSPYEDRSGFVISDPNGIGIKDTMLARAIAAAISAEIRGLPDSIVSFTTIYSNIEDPGDNRVFENNRVMVRRNERGWEIMEGFCPHLASHFLDCQHKHFK